MGLWPKFNQGSQFPQDKESLNQFFRQMTPNTAAYDAQVNTDALSAVLKHTGDSVLVTHSLGGGIGWLVGMKSPHVRGIVAYEPGSGFPFPEGEAPAWWNCQISASAATRTFHLQKRTALKWNRFLPTGFMNKSLT